MAYFALVNVEFCNMTAVKHLTSVLFKEKYMCPSYLDLLYTVCYCRIVCWLKILCIRNYEAMQCVI